MPRCDMIGFHFFNFKMLFAHYTNSFLSFVCFTFLIWTKGTDTQKLLFACQNVWINSFLAANIFIFHQSSNFLFKLLGVKFLVFELVVKKSPFYAFHFTSVLRENSFHPIDDTLEIV